MKLRMTKTAVWAAEIDDKPGGLACTMQAIADTGADLECVIARRNPEKPGRGVVFVTPLTSRDEIDKAAELGLHRTKNIATLRIEGTDRPGLGADLAKVVAETGANMHGLSAMSIGGRFVCFASFDTGADLEKVESAIERYVARHGSGWRGLISRKKEDEATHVPA